MLVQTLDQSPHLWLYNEYHRAAFDNRLRPRSFAVVDRLIARCRASQILFKPLCDNQRADRILDAYPTARAVWIYRNYRDTANSIVRLWGADARELVERVVHGTCCGAIAPSDRLYSQTAWAGARLDRSVLEALTDRWRPDLSMHEGAALLWYLRTQYYYGLGLNEHPRVLLVRYEDLAQNPEEAFRNVYDYLELPYDSTHVRSVSRESVGKERFPAIAPAIADWCQTLLSRLDADRQPRAHHAAGLVKLHMLDKSTLTVRAGKTAGAATSPRPSASLGIAGHRPKRLLLVSTTHLTVRSFLLPIARHFRSLGWRVDAAAQGIEECPECRSSCDRVWDVNWSRNPWSAANLTEALARISNLAASMRYDLVHVHTPVAAFVTRLALRRHRQLGRLKVIYTAHGFHFYQGGPTLRNWAFLGLERLAGRWTDELVVINREDEEAACRHRIVDPEHIHYMPGIGVDTARYSCEAVSPADIAQVRGQLRLNDENSLFLMIAAFDPGKRHRDLLAAFAKLEDRRPHLAFAGVGRTQPAVERLASDLGLADRVHFLGFRRDVPALVRASVATVLPSEREGLPRSAMESISLKIPVIGARIRGLVDLLGDGCGLMHEVGDVEQLAAHLQTILAKPDEARALADRAHERIAHYSLERVIELHERIYGLALAEARAAVLEGSMADRFDRNEVVERAKF